MFSGGRSADKGVGHCQGGVDIIKWEGMPSRSAGPLLGAGMSYVPTIEHAPPCYNLGVGANYIQSIELNQSEIRQFAQISYVVT